MERSVNPVRRTLIRRPFLAHLETLRVRATSPGDRLPAGTSEPALRLQRRHAQLPRVLFGVISPGRTEARWVLLTHCPATSSADSVLRVTAPDVVTRCRWRRSLVSLSVLDPTQDEDDAGFLWSTGSA